MLDTDSVSYAIRGRGRVAEHIVAHSPSELCISAITLAELRFGAESLRSQKIHRAIDAFLRDVRLMPFDDVCAGTYGRIGATLAARGEKIGELDTMIAAHAMTLGLTLVTHNERHFKRVPGLKVVSWF